MTDIILSTLTGIAFLAVFGWLIWWGTHAPPDEPEPSDIYDAMQIEDDIQRLYKAAQRLRDANAWVIELQVCRPSEALRDFNTRFCDITGEQREISIVADGSSESSRRMMELARATRDEINEELIKEIDRLNAHISYIKQNSENI